ncbi:MAG: phosphatidylinositol-specific phospholipase C1-like protein [Acidimicrobiales bacterium]|nr:phosphatidylinositol-specific phospholipase C1-like protein [Acidimicrobiales bacterium]
MSLRSMVLPSRSSTSSSTRSKLAFGVGALALLAASFTVPATGAPRLDPNVDDNVRINEVQVIGSHNSYKRMISAPEDELRRSFIGDAANEMEYQHDPLPIQFAHQRVRQIELDVFLDSAGGLYSEPMIRGFAGVGDYDPAMDAPGTKVFHIQDVDYATTCMSLVTCLTQIKGWSDANPTHLPLAILVELKDTPLSFGSFTFTTPEPWNAAAMDTLDAEIRSVFGPNDMIVPDDVRGSHTTLEDAVLTDGWPTIGDSRGKVMFMMDNGGGYRTDYLAGHPSLQGRVLFTNANPGDDDAAFVKRNDPFDSSIPGLVAAGYIVRTRADADTHEARNNDTGPRDAALASGAQYVSTDYPIAGMAVGFTTNYVAQIPGGTVARCNPINGPEECIDAELDTIYSPMPPRTETTTTTTTTTPQGSTTTPDGTASPVANPAVPVAGNADYTG